MKRRINVLSVFLMMALVFNAVGCSKMFAPSNDEVLKAINDSGILKHPGFTAISPVTILEKGDKREDGSYPVKVKVMVSFTMIKNGVSTPQAMEAQPTFLLFKSKDATGKTVWAARLGS